MFRGRCGRYAIRVRNYCAVPISASEFSSMMSGLESSTGMALAVSGGPDSMALCVLVKEWAERRGSDVVALTVDHKLREESTREAQQVKHWVNAMGIQQHTLTCDWPVRPSPSSLLHSARRYRYKLLIDYCSTAAPNCGPKYPHLLTAHHQDDQIETFLLRMGQLFSGVDGLASIQPHHPSRQGVTVSRPLLSATKARLEATCNYRQIPFVVDPTNASRRFARNRLRQILPQIDAHLGRENILNTINHFQDARDFMGSLVRDYLERNAIVGEEGLPMHCFLDLRAIQDAPMVIAERVLARVVSLVSGTECGNTTTIRSICERAKKLGRPAFNHPVVAPGSVIVYCDPQYAPDAREWLLVCKEPGAAHGAPISPRQIQPGEPVHWDPLHSVLVAGPDSIPDSSYALRTLTKKDWLEDGELAKAVKRVHPRLRHDILLLARKGEIIWVPGLKLLRHPALDCKIWRHSDLLFQPAGV